MHRVIILLILYLVTPQASAGHAKGKIASIEVSNNVHVIMFSLSTAINDTPRCNESGRFSIDLRKPSGNAAYMSLLEAKREEYLVVVEGLNTCANDWKSEDIKSITLE